MVPFNNFNPNQPSDIQSNILKQSKLPSHLSIPFQNEHHKQNNKQNHKQNTKITKQNNKNNLSPTPNANKKQPLYKQDKQYRKLYKQSKKVKSLQEQYRELQQQIKQIKELVNIQLELIDYSTQEINSKLLINNHHNNHHNNHYNNHHQLKTQKCQNHSSNQTLDNNKKIFGQQTNHNQPVQLKPLQQCLTQLFSYHQTIQAANTNYLLLSQVNKQQQSQKIYQVYNLQQRIRQLRFLLNGKQDLLAYQTATLQNNLSNNPNLQFFNQQDIQKIYIDYNLPKKQSINHLHNTDSQFKFVSKVVKQMAKLKQSVHSLEQQLNSVSNTKDQQINEQQKQNKLQDCVKQDICQLNTQRVSSKFTTPTQATPKKHKIFTQCQNTIQSAQTARPSQTNNYNSPTKIFASPPVQLTLLPLSTQNYKHSLIYRVGKLQMVQKQRSEKLKSTFRKLSQQYYAQMQNKNKLIKQYELKKDVYEYKKKMMSDKSIWKDRVREIFGQKNQNVCIGNILDELQDKQQNKINEESKIGKNYEQYVDQQIQKIDQIVDQKQSKNLTQINQQKIHQTNQIQTQQRLQIISQTEVAKIQPKSAQLQIIQLTNLSIQKIPKEASSSQHQTIFQQITNQIKMQKQRSSNSPFLKFKDKNLNRKHFSQQQPQFIKQKASLRKKQSKPGNKQNKQEIIKQHLKSIFSVNTNQNSHTSKQNKKNQVQYKNQINEQMNLGDQVEVNKQEYKAKRSSRRRKDKGRQRKDRNHQDEQMQIKLQNYKIEQTQKAYLSNR